MTTADEAVKELDALRTILLKADLIVVHIGPVKLGVDPKLMTALMERVIL